MQRFAAAGHIYTATGGEKLSRLGRQPAVALRALSEAGCVLHSPDFDPQGAGRVMAAMLEEAGVLTLYGTSFADAVVDPGGGDDTLTAIIVENPSGRQAITGKVVHRRLGHGTIGGMRGYALCLGRRCPSLRASTGTAGTDRSPAACCGPCAGLISRGPPRIKSADDPTLSKLIAEADAAGDLPRALSAAGWLAREPMAMPTSVIRRSTSSPMRADGSLRPVAERALRMGPAHG